MIYSSIIFFTVIIARFYSLFDKKLRRFFSLRKGELERIAGFFSGPGMRGKRVLWFHSASAGEFEQAKPIIEMIGKKKPGYMIVASFFSPSGFDAGLKYHDIDFCFNLPLDYRKNVDQLLDCINPQLIVYSKYDVWTNLTIEAAKRGVALVMISATLPEKSLRHKWPFLYFFRRPYALLKRIYAISEIDAARFMKIRGDTAFGRVIFSGDTRFDRVRAVVENSKGRGKRVLNSEEGRVYFIAGSTYRTSEEILLDGLKKLTGNAVMPVIVPHEIDRENINRLVKLIKSKGFVPVLYSGSRIPVSLNAGEILIVDAFGILACLYGEADIVFAGGSYRGSVHSVLEPAIFGKPVLAGPHIRNSYEAMRLAENGGLRVCLDSAGLARALDELIANPELRDGMSEKIIKFFNESAGASELIFNDMETALFF